MVRVKVMVTVIVTVTVGLLSEAMQVACQCRPASSRGVIERGPSVRLRCATHFAESGRFEPPSAHPCAERARPRRPVHGIRPTSPTRSAKLYCDEDTTK